MTAKQLIIIVGLRRSRDEFCYMANGAALYFNLSTEERSLVIYPDGSLYLTHVYYTVPCSLSYAMTLLKKHDRLKNFK